MWSFFSRDSTKDFNYEIGEAVPGFGEKSIWALNKGKSKKENREVSIWIYDIVKNGEIKLELAKAALKRLKTLRHPSILSYLDSLENDKAIYIVTEKIEPLGLYLEHLSSEQIQGLQRDFYLSYGIFQITVSIFSATNYSNLQRNLWKYDTSSKKKFFVAGF